MASKKKIDEILAKLEDGAKSGSEFCGDDQEYIGYFDADELLEFNKTDGRNNYSDVKKISVPKKRLSLLRRLLGGS